MQSKTTAYDTDIFAPLLSGIVSLVGKKYGENEDADNAMRVVVEHSRSIAFLIADGVMPANDGQGYVLRRLIRRTALFGKRLGLERLFLKDTCAASIEHMQQVYPELAQRRDIILKVVDLEESRFQETLNTGLTILDDLIMNTSSQVRNQIPGDQVFKLYDTYGFPVELTREIVARSGLSVDMEGFEHEMQKQKERARAAHKFDIVKGAGKIEIRTAAEKTEFVGYHHLSYRTKIVDILINNKSVETAAEGQEAGLILESTPFYGEMGGQVGDIGTIGNDLGKLAVTNAIHIADFTVHQGKVESGRLSVGDEIEAAVDTLRRRDIASNHTATHLLQYALRQVLGQQVQQRGSMVGPYEFRFDFSHLIAMSPEEIHRVQHIVNDKIRENLIVNAQQMGYKDAVASGAMALFDEKYGDIVRVVRIGSPVISAELCAGTHVAATGQIGFFQIVSESSIGSGLRRIQAVTGKGAETYIEHNFINLTKIAQAIGTSPAAAHEKVTVLLNDLEETRKKISGMEKELSRKSADDILNKAETISGVKVLAAKVENMRVDSLRETADRLKEKLGSSIIVLGSVYEDKPAFIAMVTPDLVQKGYHAGEIVKKVAQVAGGGGGGKAGMAQAGGKDKEKVDEALLLVKTLIKPEK
jgi:alanyl-tRNA synthetase